LHETLTISEPRQAGLMLRHASERVAAAQLALEPPALPLALACLATGHAHRVRALLRAAGAAGAGTTLPLLLARHVAWTGDLATAAAVWAAARRAMAGAAAPDATGSAGSAGAGSDRGVGAAALVMAATLAGMERTASDLGDARLAASLRARSAAARAALEQHDSGGETGAVLVRALGLAPRDGGCAPASPPAGPAGDLQAAWHVLYLAHSVLGIDPDAARHRVALRPRLPPGWDELDVRNMAMGENGVAMAVRREPGRLLCRVEQHAGAIPVTALLELCLHEPVLGVEVDGRPAELAQRHVAGGTLLPVQLVLDHVRTVTVALAG
jgi:hypothetical protein